MVSDLAIDRAADGSLTPRFETLRSPLVLRHDAAGQTLTVRLPDTADGIHVEGLERPLEALGAPTNSRHLRNDARCTKTCYSSRS